MESQLLLPTQPTISLESQALQALARWRPEETAPLKRQEIERVIEGLQDGLTPVTAEIYVLTLAKLVEFITAFGVPCPAPQTVQSIYHEQLHDLPADLLGLAVYRLRGNWTWGNRMPFPAEIKALVMQEWAKRRTMLSKAKAALLKAADETKTSNVISPERWEQLKKMLAGKGRQRKPMRQDKDGEERLEIDPELQRQWKEAGE